MGENQKQDIESKIGGAIAVAVVAVGAVVAFFVASGIIFLAFAFMRWALTVARAA